MKIKNLALLLTSSFLISTASYAGYGVLSDAYNRILPEEFEASASKAALSTNPAYLKWKEETLSKFQKKHDELGLIRSQLKDLLYDHLLEDDEEMRALARTISNFYASKLNKTGFEKELFDGMEPGMDRRHIGSGFSEDRPPEKGTHIRLTREAKMRADEIVGYRAKLQSFPARKQQWEEDIQQEQAALNELNKKMQGVQGAIDGNQKGIEKIQSILEAQNEEIVKIEKLIETTKRDREELDETAGRELAQLIEPQNEGQDASSEFDVQRKQLIKKYAEPEKKLKESQEDAQAKLQKLKEERKKNEIELAMVSADKRRLEENQESYRQKNNAHIDKINELQKKLQEGEKEVETFQVKVPEMEKERRELQEEADIYALMKYLTYLNIYMALPSKDLNIHEFEDEFSTFDDLQLPFMRELMDKRAAEVGVNSAKQAVEEEKRPFAESATKLISQQFTKDTKGNTPYNTALEVLNKNLIKGVDNVSDNVKDKLAEEILRSVVHHLYHAGFVQSYESLRPADKRTWNLSLKMTDAEFNQEIKTMNTTHRADVLIKSTLEKWRSKITKDKDSFAHRIGLTSTLFNTDFAIETYPKILSLNELKEELSKNENAGVNKSEEMNPSSDRSTWKLGLMQLKNTYFGDFSLQDPKVMARVRPIFEFVEGKAKAQPKKGEKFEAKLKRKSSEENPNQLLSRAFLKGISYMNMFHALRYDNTGKKLPELQIADSLFLSCLKEPFKDEQRLDNVMGRKALKWLERVQKYGKDFIETRALSAHTFSAMMATSKGKEEKR